MSFSRPTGRPRRIGSCEFGFVIDNLVALACSNGDGFAAAIPDLAGVLLVNVDGSSQRSSLEIDAWGEFVRGDVRR